MENPPLLSLEKNPWVMLPPGAEAPISRKRLGNWILVLRARGLPFRTEGLHRGWVVLVPEEHLDIARQEIRRFEEENVDWPPRAPDPPPERGNSLTALCVLLLLASFHNLTLLPLSLHPPVLLDWLGTGDAHAGKILSGQWWRCLTALCLHTDWLHLLGNLAFGTLFIARLCRELGSGIAWSLILASGALGNLTNALLQAPDHRAVGASTAVFGAIALAAGMNFIRYHHSLQKRWALPLVAALGLLALLGAEGERTDLGAHLLGFGWGLALGLATEALQARIGRPEALANALAALLCIALVGGAWCAALFQPLR